MTTAPAAEVDLIAEARAKIGEAKTQAMYDWPRMAKAVLSLDLRAKPGIKTVAIDPNLRLYYDPSYVMLKEVSDLVFLIKQELAHPLLMHHTRSQYILDGYVGAQREHARTVINDACDIAVNNLMRDDGQDVPSLSADRLDKNGEPLPSGLCMEQYFERMFDDSDDADEQPDNQGDQSDGSGQPDGDGESGGGSDNADGDDTDKQQDGSDNADGDDTDGQQDGGVPAVGHEGGSGADGEPRDYEDPVEQRAIGDQPGDNGLSDHDLDSFREDFNKDLGNSKSDSGHSERKRAVSGMDKPRVCPSSILRQAMTKGLSGRKYGYNYRTYRRPPRRPSFSKFIRPTYQDPLPNVCIVVDTSASMRQSDIRVGMGMIKLALTGMRLQSVRVVAADTEICNDQRNISSTMQVDLRGSGGTAMDRVINKIATDIDVASRPDLILCVTDGGTSWPDYHADVPLISCITRPASDYPPRIQAGYSNDYSNWWWEAPPDWMTLIHLA